MVGNVLSPVGYGYRNKFQKLPWFILAALYTLGNIVAAMTVGMVLAALAQFSSRLGLQDGWSYWAIGVISILYVPRQLGLISLPPLLQSTRQVPRRWAYNYPRWKTALLFGLGLGSGFYTRIVVPTFYLLVVWPFLIDSLGWTLFIWGIYGFVRSLNVWWIAFAAPIENFYLETQQMALALMQKYNLMQRINAIVLILIIISVIAEKIRS